MAHADAVGEMTTVYRLGPDAYLEDDWFRQEQARLIGQTWTLVASTDDFQQPGDYVAGAVGDAPVVVVHDGEQLRAFHNLCRHRGMVMLEGQGNVGNRISCFYHQWQYALDGSLRVVPQRKEQFPDLDLAGWGLQPAGLEIWEGLVFVHPDADAPPLTRHLGRLPENIGSFHPGRLEQVGHDVIEARCNWKLFVENHVDVYHLWYLHEQSLGDFDHTKFEHRHLDGHWVSYEPLRNDAYSTAALSAQTRPIAHLEGRDLTGIGAHLVFPNLMFATTVEFFASYRAVPVAPDHTLIDLRVRAEPGADADGLMQAVHAFIDEDVAACEAVQAGMRSPRFSVGPLARTHEHPITAFHDHVLAAVGQ
jgi:choline monooxygenase